MIIKSFEFSHEGKNLACLETKTQDWPVVYLINNDKNMYIGETSSFVSRFGQHLDDSKKKGLTNIHVIIDDEFNKSAALDIEQSLIRMLSADQKFKLLNNNAGHSPKHNYYQREKYLNKIEGTCVEDSIWRKLEEIGLVQTSYNEIVNSDMFKYSPYTSLTLEQEEVCYKVLNDVCDGLNSNTTTTCIVGGNAGTGKTILAIYLMSLFANANNNSIDLIKEDILENTNKKIKVLHKLKEIVAKNGSLRIGYVLPMASIRKTLKKVFRNSNSELKSTMVIGPTDIINEKYDILIVDESHRMSKRKNSGWISSFDKCCEKLGLPFKETNTLDWIVKCSKTRILFYDKNQTIKGSDITDSEFEKTIAKTNIKRYNLVTQLRCKGGKAYTEYLDKIFCCNVDKKQNVDNYDIKVFDDPNKMIKKIKILNEKVGLCRIVAGYAWKWKTKNKSLQEIENNNLYDINFNGQKYVWNMKNIEWILRENAINEIGCVHTIQGYDLNYIGVIFGQEIDYDPTNKNIIIYPEKFYDTNVKKNVTEIDLKRYIINAYKVMLERGIKGCYIYCCNNNLNEYLKHYLDQI